MPKLILPHGLDRIIMVFDHLFLFTHALLAPVLHLLPLQLPLLCFFRGVAYYCFIVIVVVLL